MKVVLLLTIAAFAFIPLLLLSDGLKAQELHRFTKTLYEDLVEELNGAHLLIAASHVSVIHIAAYIISKNKVYNHWAQVPPTMIIEKDSDGTFRYSGYSADACLYLSQAFKFT